MRYVSIDIETTGLDENEHQIIEFGAIIEDSKNPKSYEESAKFRRLVLSPTGNYNFSSFAAKLNAKLIEEISAFENRKGKSFVTSVQQEGINSGICTFIELMPEFKEWLYRNGFTDNGKGYLTVIAAGKNFASFDKRFIQSIPDFESYGVRFLHRSIDPTTAFIDWENDEVPPSTDECKKRLGLTGEVKHEALADAWDVIQLLRAQYKARHYMPLVAVAFSS